MAARKGARASAAAAGICGAASALGGAFAVRESLIAVVIRPRSRRRSSLAPVSPKHPPGLVCGPCHRGFHVFFGFEYLGAALRGGTGTSAPYGVSMARSPARDSPAVQFPLLHRRPAKETRCGSALLPLRYTAPRPTTSRSRAGGPHGIDEPGSTRRTARSPPTSATLLGGSLFRAVCLGYDRSIGAQGHSPTRVTPPRSHDFIVGPSFLSRHPRSCFVPSGCSAFFCSRVSRSDWSSRRAGTTKFSASEKGGVGASLRDRRVGTACLGVRGRMDRRPPGRGQPLLFFGGQVQSRSLRRRCSRRGAGPSSSFPLTMSPPALIATFPGTRFTNVCCLSVSSRFHRTTPRQPGASFPAGRGLGLESPAHWEVLLMMVFLLQHPPSCARALPSGRPACPFIDQLSYEPLKSGPTGRVGCGPDQTCSRVRSVRCRRSSRINRRTFREWQ